MAKIKEPNVYCRNCNKHYYACMSCMAGQKWRSFCCSIKCFEEYTQKVLDEREALKKARENNTDYSDEEFSKIKKMSYDEALEKTKEDLSDYINENQGKSISQIVDIVNEDIDKANLEKNNYKKRKNNKR